MKQKIFIDIVSFSLILLFVYTAFSKLFTHSEFKSQLEKSPLIPFPGLFALLLPLAELVLAGMLAVNTTRKAGLTFSAVLLGLFTLYILYMLLFVKHLPCSCGGVLKNLTWTEHILFNSGFLLLTITAIFFENKSNKPGAYLK